MNKMSFPLMNNIGDGLTTGFPDSVVEALRMLTWMGKR